MQAVYHSDSLSGASDISEAHLGEAANLGFTITPQDMQILQHYLEEFQEDDSSARAQLIDRIMGELYRLRPVNSPFDKKDAKKKIQKWFYNHYSNPRREYIKFTRKWSARNAFHQLNRDEVSNLAKEQSGLQPGHPQFLGALQNAATTLWNDLDDESKDDYIQAARDWTTEAPPRHIQSRMATSMRKRIIQDFQSQLYKTCGIRSLVLTAYESEDHDLKICMDDVHSVLDDGKDFKKFCPDWKHADIWQKWSDFGVKCFSQEPDEEPEEEDPAKLNMKPIPVHLDEAGFPELPPTTSMDKNKTKIVQSMLREYCTAHIRFITGHKNQVISWGSLAMDPSSWIDRECTPDGFVWKDPSKIRIGEIHRLLDHWRDRIDRGLIGLVWVPTCPLFQDQVNAPSHRRRFRQAMGVPQDDSDDEVFILPQSDEIEQEESGSNDDEQHSYRTSQVPSDVGQHSAIPTGYPHASMSDIAGPSSLHRVPQNREAAIPRPFPAKGEWYIDVPQKPKEHGQR